MAWESAYHVNEMNFGERHPHIGAFSVNENCFIRKEHKCGKIFGASKSCFIACPTEDALEPILDLMAEKLSKANIETVIAVKERAYGQDIFCTKICGRIIESRFCVVILDDTILDSQNIPNPNVYYEYGLMTCLGKHIVPLQKDGLKLAFNIQSYDTIKYNPKNLAPELDRAIRDAIRITESTDKKPQRTSLADKAIMRKLELAGFEAKDEKWFLWDAIADTKFRGFSQPLQGFYLYLGKVDNIEDCAKYLDDLAVALYRTEKTANQLTESLPQLQANPDQQLITTETAPTRYPGLISFSVADRFLSSKALVDDYVSKLTLMKTFYVAFIVNTPIDTKDFAEKATALLRPYPRYRLVFSDSEALAFENLKIPLSDITH